MLWSGWSGAIGNRDCYGRCSGAWSLGSDASDACDAIPGTSLYVWLEPIGAPGNDVTGVMGVTPGPKTRINASLAATGRSSAGPGALFWVQPIETPPDPSNPVLSPLGEDSKVFVEIRPFYPCAIIRHALRWPCRYCSCDSISGLLRLPRLQVAASTLRQAPFTRATSRAALVDVAPGRGRKLLLDQPIQKDMIMRSKDEYRKRFDCTGRRWTRK
jgi:hypothetical protein